MVHQVIIFSKVGVWSDLKKSTINANEYIYEEIIVRFEQFVIIFERDYRLLHDCKITLSTEKNNNNPLHKHTSVLSQRVSAVRTDTFS